MKASAVSDIGLPQKASVPWIAVLGPDGSGKSSVIAKLASRLAQHVAGVQVYHWRPGYLRPSKGNGVPVIDPHGEPPRGLVTSLAKLIFLVLDWRIGYRTVLAVQRAEGNLVLFDRHYVDLLVDPRRYRYGGPLPLARWVARLIPQPDLFILLDAPVDVLQRRKKEVTREECARQRACYAELVGAMKNGLIIDASRPLPDVVTEAESAILKSINRQDDP